MVDNSHNCKAFDNGSTRAPNAGTTEVSTGFVVAQPEKMTALPCACPNGLGCEVVAVPHHPQPAEYEAMCCPSKVVCSIQGNSTVPQALQRAFVADRWQCCRKIATGSFGETYLAQETGSDVPVAIKVEFLKARHPQLLHEARILRQMQGVVGFPRLHYYGIHLNQYAVMVMELLGPSLEEVFCRWGNQQFSLPTVAMIGQQMVDRLAALHRHGFIHRDVKPENFLVGLPPHSHQIYCIDFGLAVLYRDPKTNTRIRYSNTRSLTGTARYASVNAHAGIEPSRRDDIVSVGYVMVYFAKGGQLPWQGLRAISREDKYRKIMEKKLSTSLEDLTVDLPAAFLRFLRHARMLQFDEEPDYEYLQDRLAEVIDGAIGSPAAGTMLKAPFKSNSEPESPTTLKKLMLTFESGLKQQYCAKKKNRLQKEASNSNNIQLPTKELYNSNGPHKRLVNKKLPGEVTHILSGRRSLEQRSKKVRSAFCLACVSQEAS